MNPFNKYLSKEDHVQHQVVQYVQMKYNITPIALNTESNKTPFERFKSKYLGLHRGIPDLLIPVANNKYYGLFIELKADGVKVFKKNGDLYKSEHLEIQNNYHEGLIKNGYGAMFCIGFDHAKKVIDWYLQDN